MQTDNDMKIFDKEYAKYEYEYEYLFECRKDLMARLKSIHRAIIEDQKSRIYPEKYSLFKVTLLNNC